MQVDVDKIVNEPNTPAHKVMLRKRGSAARRSKIKLNLVRNEKLPARRTSAFFLSSNRLGAHGRYRSWIVSVIDIRTLEIQIETMRARIKELEFVVTNGRHACEFPPAFRLATLSSDKRGSPAGAVSVPSNINMIPSHPPHLILPAFAHLDDLDLPIEVIELVRTYPEGMRDIPYNKSVFSSCIPLRGFAQKWSNAYFDCLGRAFLPIKREDYEKNILEPIYSRPIELIHMHCLAVFFALLGNGLLGQNTAEAETLILVSRACLAFTPILSEFTYWAVLALYLISYMDYSYQHSSAVWLDLGLACRIVSTIGLDRDDSNSYSDEEGQRRRSIFWELCFLDLKIAIVYGRAPSYNLKYVGCPFPSLTPNEEEKDWTYHTCRFHFMTSCMQTVADYLFSTEKPEYSSLLKLSAKIQTFPVPTKLQVICGGNEDANLSDDLTTAIEQTMIVDIREGSLLYLHRSYLLEALRSQPLDPLGHDFAPSVFASFNCAIRAIRSFKALYLKYQDAILSRLVLWSHLFSSCAVLSELVITSPLCVLAEASVNELKDGLTLYLKGAETSYPRSDFNTLETLCRQAFMAFQAAKEQRYMAPFSSQMTNELGQFEHETGPNSSSLPAPGLPNNHSVTPTISTYDWDQMAMITNNVPFQSYWTSPPSDASNGPQFSLTDVNACGGPSEPFRNDTSYTCDGSEGWYPSFSAYDPAIDYPFAYGYGNREPTLQVPFAESQKRIPADYNDVHLH